MPDYGKCSLCKGKYKLMETKDVKGTEYTIVKCEKCGHQVAKHD